MTSLAEAPRRSGSVPGGDPKHPLVSVDGIWAKLEYLARDRGHRRRLREEHPELATVVTVFSDEGAFRDGDPA